MPSFQWFFDPAFLPHGPHSQCEVILERALSTFARRSGATSVGARSTARTMLALQQRQSHGSQYSLPGETPELSDFCAG
jgi:hypothetical protein